MTGLAPVVWMIAASIASWLVMALAVDRVTSFEILCGMLGPLAAVTASWVMAERTYQRRPEAMTAILIAGFAGKLVFFGAYITVGLKILLLRPVPFVLSFTIYFIVLYLIEAQYLRRLFWGGMRASR